MNFNQPKIFRRDLPATSVRFYYMHGCHLFTRLDGQTLDEVLIRLDEVEAEDPGGMLCQPSLLNGDIELRRVGVNVHSRCDREKWAQDKKVWREEAEKDEELVSLMSRPPMILWTTLHSLDSLLDLLRPLGRPGIRQILSENWLPIDWAAKSAVQIKTEIIGWAARQKLSNETASIRLPQQKEE